MIGRSAIVPEIEEDLQAEIAKKQLREVSEKYNLDVEDVDVEFDPTLPYEVMGRTHMGRGRQDPKITVGKSFLNANEYKQLETMTHEGIHVLQDRNQISDWLANNFDTSEKFIEEVKQASQSRDIQEIEGITEVIKDNILLFETSTGYPYEKQKKEAELRSKGLDPRSELVEDIEDEMNGLIDNYKQVDNSFEEGDIYVEQGSFADFDYNAVMIGYDDPEADLNEYLEEINSQKSYLGEMLGEDIEELEDPEDYTASMDPLEPGEYNRAGA